MAAESIYSALMKIKATLEENWSGDSGSDDGGSGGGSGGENTRLIIPKVIIHENAGGGTPVRGAGSGGFAEGIYITCDYTPHEIAELLLSGRLGAVQVNLQMQNDDIPLLTITTLIISLKQREDYPDYLTISLGDTVDFMTVPLTFIVGYRNAWIINGDNYILNGSSTSAIKRWDYYSGLL